jgi:glucosyl-3-phosphoglycerate synthase
MSIDRPPDRGLLACVVVPARDEERRIGACIAALGAQRGVAREAYEVILVLDACADDTADRAARAAAGAPGLRLHMVAVDVHGSGPARRLGMELAAARLARAGRDRGLIASTDADTVADRDWLRHQLDLVAAGAEAIGGMIEVDPEDLRPGALARRDARLAGRVEATGDPRAPHPFFSGASLGLTLAAHRRVGGVPERVALEDRALEGALSDAGIPIVRSRAVRVRTSGRTRGRVRHGLSADLRVDAWSERNTFTASDFDAADLASWKAETVTVVLPCRETAGTIGAILDAIAPLERLGLVDEVLVIDAASADGTAAVAAAHGARVVQESEVLPEMGPCRGKGDAMWRALAVARGDVIAYVDADTTDFEARFVTGILGPLIADPAIALVKGAFRRPLRAGDTVLPDEGGRVTELVARPVLSLVAPELGCFAQPLAGETAARRDVLEAIPFPVGYGVETAMLIDVWRARGLDAMAQVDLGTRQNRHQPLRRLGGMALEVMCAALSRGLPPDAYAALTPGRMLVPGLTGEVGPRDVALAERPPMSEVLAATP